MAPRRSHAQTLEDRRTRGTASFRCRVCRGIHPLRQCNRFLRLTAEKRLRAVLLNKYCANCLAHQHSGPSCRSRDRCRICRQPHHTLLHFHEANRSATPRSRPHSNSRPLSESRPHSNSRTLSNSRSPSRDPPTLTSLLQLKSVNVLPTALVRIHNGEKTFDLRALIDPCAAVSRINASLALTLKLRHISVGEDRVCSAIVSPVTSAEPNFETVFKMEPDLQFRTPLRALGDGVRERFQTLALADDHFHRPCTVAMVLGSDVYPNIIREGFMPSQGGLPIAQSTIFGWILSGPCSL